MQESSLEGFGVDNNPNRHRSPFDMNGPVFGGFGTQNRWVLVHPKTKEPLLGSLRGAVPLEDGRCTGKTSSASPGPVYVVAHKNFGTVIDFGIGPYKSECS
jgi:hypothetical protein